MPYIKQKDREKFKNALELMPKFENKGELEYVVFYLMMHYMKYNAFRYTVLHDITYAVVHCADEFRRRWLDKRETQAREENGEIYANLNDLDKHKSKGEIK